MDQSELLIKPTTTPTSTPTLTASPEGNSSIPLVLCPFCQKNIPSLSLTPSKGRMQIKVNCTCSDEEKSMTLRKFIQDLSDNQHNALCKIHSNKGIKYCIECLEWLCSECLRCHFKFTKKHPLIDYQLSVRCATHNKSYSYYCRQCQANLCNQCHPLHSTHSLIPITQMDLPSEDQPEVFEKTMATNKDRITKFIGKIDQQIARLNQMKQDILSIYNANEMINQDLMILYQSITSAALTFKSYPSYELMRLRDTLTINLEEQIEERQSIEDEFVILKEYLQKHYLLLQTSSVNELETTLIGHSNCIGCLIELSNGVLVSGSYDKTIKLWDLITTDLKETLSGHNGEVRCLVELSENGLIASGSSDKTIRLWLLTNDNNECKAVLTGHTGSVYSLAKLSNGRLASGSWDDSIKLWDLSTNECKATYPNTGTIYSLIELKDSRLASASSNHLIKLWNTTSNECKKVLNGHTNEVLCLAELDNGVLVSGSMDKTIKVWNLSKNKCRLTLIGHNRSVYALVRLDDGRFASGSNDNTIKIWSSTSFECSDTFSAESSVQCLSKMKDGKLSAGCGNNSIKIWDVSLLCYYQSN